MITSDHSGGGIDMTFEDFSEFHRITISISYFSNNRPPKHSSYYGGGNDIFSNFRDFADIKKDGKEFNNYDAGYYY